ncbi:MAG: hypothetical protein PWQ28_17 [Candidatus Woesearchaeota archaeon]|nr:hypothetical protein [Candidatus Woesearchaeota archaeon]
MDKELYDKISLLAEYDFKWGGAQRMLSAISKRMNKAVYVLTDRKNPEIIWDVVPIPEIPPTEIVFSPVVDKYQLRIIEGKKHIKFCHSGTSLENFSNNQVAKTLPWLTHRERVYQFWRNKGFNIDLIHNGYIPYDKTQIENTPVKKDQGVFISRIHPSKCPELAIKAFQNSKVPLYIAGSHEFRNYVESLKKDVGKKIIFVPPDEGTGLSLKIRDDILRESKILVHCSLGGMHDYLEYSILDGLSFNCIPLCITPEPEQFSIVEKKRIGKVTRTTKEAAELIPEILDNYETYLKNAREFMESFLSNQNKLWARWESKLEEICSKLV